MNLVVFLEGAYNYYTQSSKEAPSMDKAREQEIVAMHQGGLGLKFIADELSISTTAVRNVLKKYGEPTTTVKRVTRDEDNIIEMYLSNAPVSAILRKHKMSYTVLYTILDAHDVPTRKSIADKGRAIALDRAIEMYERGEPIWSIVNETGVAQPKLHAELHIREVPLRRPRRNFTRPMESGETKAR